MCFRTSIYKQKEIKMKKFLLLTMIFASLTAGKIFAQTVSISPSATQTVTAGQSLTFSSSNNGFNSGTKTRNWVVSPTSGVSFTNGSSSVTMTFANAGSYSVTLTISVGSQTATSSATTVIVLAAGKSYGDPVYTGNFRGGHTMFGNTSMAIYTSGDGTTGGTVDATKANYFSIASDGTTSIYGNDQSNMQFVDVDYQSGSAGGVTNASSADLILPSGTNSIKFARLYWGGHINTSDITGTNLTAIKIRKGSSGTYTSLTVPVGQVNTLALSTGNSGTTAYQSYADITNIVQNNGAGTYTVANIAATTGSVKDGGAYAGWSIVVAYENDAMPYYSVRIYDAFMLIKAGVATAQTVTLTNFNAPNNTLASGDAYLSTFAWEGDANLAVTSSNPAGDYLQINGTTYSDAVNPATNMWNGTISNNGNLVTTTNPNFKNQMGIDIDQINVGTGYGISPSATTVSVTFGTEADQYYPSIFAFSMRMQDPSLTINKTVQGSSSGNVITSNETLTYTIAGQNTGAGAALNSVIVDTLPLGVTYIANSIQIVASSGTGITGAKTDAAGDDQAWISTTASGRQYITFNIGAGANSSAGGTLSAGDSYQVQFQVLTPANKYELVTISNTAYITAQSQTLANIVNQSTVVISTALPVKLGNFTAVKSGSNALLNWTTLSELDNDHFNIERSTDGVNFEKMGTVNGSGTTALSHNYDYTDPLTGLSGIIYYRLEDVDLMGYSTYSNVIALRLDGSALSVSFSIYPNPFVSNIKISVNSTKETTGNVIVNNIAGQQVYTQAVTLQNGQNTIIVNNLGGLRPGMYIINFITEDGRIAQKIIKN
jgi:uncharacterized repeat protein (TIGR01451 family)